MSKNYDFLDCRLKINPRYSVRARCPEYKKYLEAQEGLDKFNKLHNLPRIKRGHQKLLMSPKFLGRPKLWAMQDSDLDGVPNYADRYPNDPFKR